MTSTSKRSRPYLEPNFERRRRRVGVGGDAGGANGGGGGSGESGPSTSVSILKVLEVQIVDPAMFGISSGDSCFSTEFDILTAHGTQKLFNVIQKRVGDYDFNAIFHGNELRADQAIIAAKATFKEGRILIYQRGRKGTVDAAEVSVN